MIFNATSAEREKSYGTIMTLLKKGNGKDKNPNSEPHWVKNRGKHTLSFFFLT